MPLEHKKAHRNVLNLIEDYQPSEVINIGDLNDYTSSGRWSAGKRAEYGMSVRQEAAYARRHHLEPFRKRYDGPYTLLGSNHGERPYHYVKDRAPAIDDDADQYREDALLQLDDYGVSYVPDFYDFAPGWVATHGHLGFNLSPIPGRTALNAARNKVGKNVVMGHTHRLGLESHTVGYAGKTSTTYGLEVGHLMDIRKASYLKSGAANWQMGFGFFYVAGSQVTPTPISVRSDGSFVFEGNLYK
ncbi:hypothetical protein FGW37_05265 [Streptomyces rectiverticillatus]|uniref:hypothetical protein n=1 Tax=Streptomyces rectiverticillatus TaxID=173860 RepID=UPI0015C393B6|nr:hypothetical protein [Streptomyces rectiverticillatus]QLE71090.1 hypothetical protein FGW37_05265 [Streptomyces rectiverticillatus]